MEGGQAGPARGSHVALEGGDHVRKTVRERRPGIGARLEIHNIFKAEGDIKVIKSSPLLVPAFVVLIIKNVEPQKRELAQGHSRT